MAITDGTAARRCPPASAFLGMRRIVATESCAQLEDGTMAGSVLTMDVGFRRMTHDMGFSAVDAAIMCSTTPARELGLVGHGVSRRVRSRTSSCSTVRGEVVQTYVSGRLAYARGAHEGNSPVRPPSKPSSRAARRAQEARHVSSLCALRLLALPAASVRLGAGLRGISGGEASLIRHRRKAVYRRRARHT